MKFISKKFKEMIGEMRVMSKQQYPVRNAMPGEKYVLQFETADLNAASF